MKCAKCGSERFLIEENELYEVRIGKGKMSLIESYGCDFKDLKCYECETVPDLDYSQFEFKYKF
jgi:phosphoenolpyruvate synthase/pyruvate phosphate dikinase